MGRRERLGLWDGGRGRGGGRGMEEEGEAGAVGWGKRERRGPWDGGGGRGWGRMGEEGEAGAVQGSIRMAVHRGRRGRKGGATPPLEPPPPLPMFEADSQTDFFDTLTTQIDQISYVKHVLAPVFMCLCVTLFGCWGGGGAPKGSRAQPAHAVFQPRQLKNGRPSPLFEVPCRRQQNFASAPLAPGGFELKIFWLAFGGDHRGTLGGGGSQPNPPHPLVRRPWGSGMGDGRACDAAQAVVCVLVGLPDGGGEADGSWARVQKAFGHRKAPLFLGSLEMFCSPDANLVGFGVRG